MTDSSEHNPLKTQTVRTEAPYTEIPHTKAVPIAHKVTIALILAYLGWVATPFDDRINVDDAVGLPEERVSQLIEHGSIAVL